MAGEMLCPDCGGVVGATEMTASGPPCTCFSSTSGSDTAMDMPLPAETPQPKVCVVCGKDVAGHRRLKDSRGYICYDCAKAEQRRERGGRVRCGSCGRLVDAKVVVDFEGERICPQCSAAQKKKLKQKIKKIGIESGYKWEERRRLYLLLCFAGLLLLIIIYSRMKGPH